MIQKFNLLSRKKNRKKLIIRNNKIKNKYKTIKKKKIKLIVNN